MSFKKDERLKEYTDILTQTDPLSAAQLLSLTDMITEDLTAREVAESEQEKLTSDNTSLRDTNHKLFLRVTGGKSPDDVEGPELSPEEQAENAFNDLIEKGLL